MITDQEAMLRDNLQYMANDFQVWKSRIGLLWEEYAKLDVRKHADSGRMIWTARGDILEFLATFETEVGELLGQSKQQAAYIV